MEAKPATSNEKRDFFRVDEDIHLEFRTVSASFAEENYVGDAFEDSDESLRLIEQLNKIEKESDQSLKVLADKNRLLGDYLQTLNKKIDTIGRHIAFTSEESLKQRPKTRVSLSEDGIGFICERAIYKDSLLAVRLIFLPNYVMASTFAKVVRCVEKGDNFQVAARFYQIYDKDRQIISRQILKSQVRGRTKK